MYWRAPNAWMSAVKYLVERLRGWGAPQAVA